MEDPNSTNYELISTVINKYRVRSTLSMIYGELYEQIHSLDNRGIEPGNYLMYIDTQYTNDLESYKLVIIKNGTKLNCSIYDILKTSLVKDILIKEVSDNV